MRAPNTAHRQDGVVKKELFIVNVDLEEELMTENGTQQQPGQRGIIEEQDSV